MHFAKGGRHGPEDADFWFVVVETDFVERGAVWTEEITLHLLWRCICTITDTNRIRRRSRVWDRVLKVLKVLKVLTVLSRVCVLLLLPDCNAGRRSLPDGDVERGLLTLAERRTRTGAQLARRRSRVALCLHCRRFRRRENVRLNGSTCRVHVLVPVRCTMHDVRCTRYIGDV